MRTYLPAEMQQTIVETISDGEVSRLADEFLPDDTVDFLEEVFPQTLSKKCCLAWIKKPVSALPNF